MGSGPSKEAWFVMVLPAILRLDLTSLKKRCRWDPPCGPHGRKGHNELQSIFLWVLIREYTIGKTLNHQTPSVALW